MSLATDILKRAAALPVKPKNTAKKNTTRNVPSVQWLAHQHIARVPGVVPLTRPESGQCEWRAFVHIGKRNYNIGSFKSVHRAWIARKLWLYWQTLYDQREIPTKPNLLPGGSRRYNCERV